MWAHWIKSRTNWKAISFRAIENQVFVGWQQMSQACLTKVIIVLWEQAHRQQVLVILWIGHQRLKARWAKRSVLVWGNKSAKRFPSKHKISSKWISSLTRTFIRLLPREQHKVELRLVNKRGLIQMLDAVIETLIKHSTVHRITKCSLLTKVSAKSLCLTLAMLSLPPVFRWLMQIRES